MSDAAIGERQPQIAIRLLSKVEHAIRSFGIRGPHRLKPPGTQDGEPTLLGSQPIASGTSLPYGAQRTVGSAAGIRGNRRGLMRESEGAASEASGNETFGPIGDPSQILAWKTLIQPVVSESVAVPK